MINNHLLPIPTRVPTVNSEYSIFHSWNGNKGLLMNDEDCRTLFQVMIEEPLLLDVSIPKSWGDEGNDTAFWVESTWFLEWRYTWDESSWSPEW